MTGPSQARTSKPEQGAGSYGTDIDTDLRYWNIN